MPKQALFVVILVCLVAVAIELFLVVASVASPTVARLLTTPWVSQTLPDPKLVVRPNPLHPEHDDRGFRNPRGIERATVVALGDSQTYGTGVGPDDAWPRRLERILDEPVYGIAFGGYGPVHGDILWDEAMALAPQVVIEAFYLGNDLFDAFSLVYEHGQKPELATSDPELETRLRAAERAEPLVERISKVAYLGATPEPEDGASAAGDASRFSIAGIIGRTKVYGLLRRLRFESSRRLASALVDRDAAWEAAKLHARAHPDYCQIFEDAGARTIFTSEYRQTALDLSDERIAEGLEVALRAFDEMQSRASASGIRFLVVVIPTKETVFAERWKAPTPAFERLVASEAQAMERVRAHLREQGIELLEVLPALRAALERGDQPYPVDRDGHPSPAGHEAIAQAVAARLTQAR